MKILLTQDVKKLGKQGEIVDISDGYAKNYILPQHMGIEATKAVMNEWKAKKASEENRKKVEEEKAIQQAKELEGKSVTIQVKAGENGRLFGSITTQVVAEALEKQLAFPVDKKKIQLPEGIKGLGEYEFAIKLHAKAVAKLTLKVEGNA